MEELLAALKEGDTEKVDELACGMFINNDGTNNWQKMREFEKFANCKFFASEQDSFGWLIGGIAFENKNFYYG